MAVVRVVRSMPLMLGNSITRDGLVLEMWSEMGTVVEQMDRSNTLTGSTGLSLQTADWANCA